MATWSQVQQNPTLYPLALLPGEGEEFKWQADADKPHSSQMFCVSAFGMLRQLPARHAIIDQILGPNSLLPSNDELSWEIELEVEFPRLLSEYGNVQATSIDALLQNRISVFTVEAKFLSDAMSGFGGCSQRRTKCAGFYGPGSDLKTGTNAWCRLEVWEGGRSPRTYWTMGRAFFQESVFAKQTIGDRCPLAGPNYQLMRNFLFAAALAQRKKKPSFGVIVVAPTKTAAKVQRQIDSFRNDILQPQFGASVYFLPYERLIELMQQSGDAAAGELAEFLSARIAALIH